MYPKDALSCFLQEPSYMYICIILDSYSQNPGEFVDLKVQSKRTHAGMKIQNTTAMATHITDKIKEQHCDVSSLHWLTLINTEMINNQSMC